MRLIIPFLFAVALIAAPGLANAANFPNTQVFKPAQKRKEARKQRKINQMDARQLYGHARQLLNDGHYRDASKRYEHLQSEYPFSRYAIQAQLDAAYAKYKLRKPQSALAIIKRFLREHARNANVDYAYYLRGLVNFAQADSLSNHLFRTDAARREDQFAQDAFSDFATLLRRYPNSRYAADARQRMVYLKNQLARRQWYIANYYMQREAWLSANRRAQGIVKNFQDTKWARKALKIMQESYAKLDMKQAAENVAQIRKKNARGDS